MLFLRWPVDSPGDSCKPPANITTNALTNKNEPFLENNLDNHLEG